MKAKIGINGLGRIGRMVLRSIFEENHKQLKVNHINNRTDINTACGLKDNIKTTAKLLNNEIFINP